MTNDEWTFETVLIASLCRDRDLQARETTDSDTVDTYVELLERGVKLPPPAVYRDGDLLLLADGHHTVTSHEKRGETHILVKVRTGTRAEAILYAAGANATHGLRRTNKDKRRAVRLVLGLRAAWTNGVVAEHCSVSDRLVTDVRRELGLPDTPTRVDRRGRTINVEGIGRRPAAGTPAGAAAKSVEARTVAPPSSAVRLSDERAAAVDRLRDVDAREPEDLDALLVVRKVHDENDYVNAPEDHDDTEARDDIQDSDDSDDSDDDVVSPGLNVELDDVQHVGAPENANDDTAAGDEDGENADEEPTNVTLAYEFAGWSEDMMSVSDAADLLGLTTEPGRTIIMDVDVAREHVAARLEELRHRYCDANVARAIESVNRYNEIAATPAFQSLVSRLKREKPVSGAGPLNPRS